MSNTIGSGTGIGNITWSSDLKIEGDNKINRDQDGVGQNKTPPAMQLPLPNPTSKPDMMKMMAAFEDLIILMSKLAKETQKAEREGEIASLAAKISMLLAAAEEKQEGANKMMTMAIVSLVISVVSAAISVVGAGLSLGGAFKGASAAKDATANINQFNKIASRSGGQLEQLGLGQKMQAVSGAFQQASGKLTGFGQLADAIGKGVGAAAGYTSTQGQAESMKAQARADKMQAHGEEHGAQAQKSQNFQQDMRDLLNKMVELLNAFYAAQDKIANAAAH